MAAPRRRPPVPTTKELAALNRRRRFISKAITRKEGEVIKLKEDLAKLTAELDIARRRHDAQARKVAA